MSWKQKASDSFANSKKKECCKSRAGPARPDSIGLFGRVQALHVLGEPGSGQAFSDCVGLKPGSGLFIWRRAGPGVASARPMNTPI